MDKVKTGISVQCPDHKDQLLERVNPDPTALKHVYCAKCLNHTKDIKPANLEFPSISDFLTTAAATFDGQRNWIEPISEVPEEFLNVVVRRAETLKNLAKHIEEERQKSESFFNNMRNVVLDVVEQLKNEHLELLDKQVTDLSGIFTTLEKLLKRFYPKKEDIAIMFPTREDLISRLEKIDTASDLNDFFRDVKQNIELSQDDDLSSDSDEEFKARYLRIFSNKIEESEEYKPESEEIFPTSGTAKLEIKKKLDHLFVKLRNPIPTNLDELNYIHFPRSTIIKPQDFVMFKEWLPEIYRDIFSPKLLFRMTRDGESSVNFHSLCDKKGPTITLIKCKYGGAYQTSIIGAFSDKDFDENGKGFIESKQAFIFSLNEKIKCPISTPEFALCNGRGIDICFGYIGAIEISKNFKSCRSLIFPPFHYNVPYGNVHKIIPAEIYENNCEKEYKFKVEEVEVYQV